MSRIGKLPIPIPDKVTVTLSGVHIVVDGPKGKLERDLHPAVKVSIEELDGKKAVVVTRKNEERIARSMHGLVRTLVANMVQGVVQPYKKAVEVSGVGYRVELLGRTLKVQCGFSHDVLHPVPEGVEVTVDKLTTIHLSSPDKEQVGQLAAELRAYKPCEPYKGKGMKYVGEQIRRKEGKTGAG